MNRRSAAIYLLASLVFLLSGALAQNRTAIHPAISPSDSTLIPFSHFSATISGGLMNEAPKRIYRSGDLLRVDLTDNFHLTDLHDRSTRAIHTDYCSHFPAPDVAVYPFVAFRELKVERSPSDEIQTIDGHPCRLENATLTPKAGSSGPIKVKLWEAQDLQSFPLKVEIIRADKPTITVNFSDVNLQPPNPELFKIPSRCPDGPAHGQKGVRTLAAATRHY
jgi:hypothetical protein